MAGGNDLRPAGDVEVEGGETVDQELREAMRAIFQGLAQIGAALPVAMMNYHVASLSTVRPASITLTSGLAALTTKLGSRLGARRRYDLQTPATRSPLLQPPRTKPVETNERLDHRPAAAEVSRA